LPEVSRLIGELSSASPWFAELWNRRDVAVRRRELKRLFHPARGLTAYDCHELFSEDGTQRLIWFSPTASAA
jgi:hypothetical protein